MKYILFIFLFSVICTSCVSDKPWYDQATRFKVSDNTSNYFAPSPETSSYSIDSSLYAKLIETGSNDFCAKVAAYAMSEVELERKLPNRCHSQSYNFKSCRAEILEDTVRLIFETQNIRRSIASNKVIQVKILGSDHHSEIIHWGKEYREVEQYDGSIITMLSPKSIVVDSRLKLNKRHYELGDTIIGEIKLASYQVKGKRKIKIKEITQGKFRAIVGGAGIECQPEKALATSWLKN